jgi:hypothetical protein
LIATTVPPTAAAAPATATGTEIPPAAAPKPPGMPGHTAAGPVGDTAAIRVDWHSRVDFTTSAENSAVRADAMVLVVISM